MGRSSQWTGCPNLSAWKEETWKHSGLNGNGTRRGLCTGIAEVMGRFPIKPEFFQVSSFHTLRLKHPVHCDDQHIILKCSFSLTLCFVFVFGLFFSFQGVWQLCVKNVGCVQAPVRGSAQGLRGGVQADTLPLDLVVCKLNLTLLARQSRTVQLRKVSTAGLITFKGVIDVTRN